MKISLSDDKWNICICDYSDEAAEALPSVISRTYAANRSEVTIPHDALIADAKDFYRDCVILYKRRLGITVKPDRRYLIYFEGMYMDSTVFVGDKEVGRWPNGYTSACMEITDYITSPDDEVCVRMVIRCPNSRWYGGAGIYRDVWLYDMPRSFIKPDGIYVSTDVCDTDTGKNDASGADAQLSVSHDATVNIAIEPDIASKDKDARFETEYILSPYHGDASENRPASCDHVAGSVEDRIDDTDVIYRSGLIGYSTDGPTTVSLRPGCEVKLWDTTNPALYRLTVRLYKDGELACTEETVFGFRDIRFTSDKGFFLNGRHIKLRGVCLHSDSGALGIAFHKDIALRQLKLMKDMGANAIRFAHNPPAPEYLRLCDEQGMLVMDEIFDCWRGGKNPYDYGRFFDDWSEKDMESFIRRDRNHPSVIMWSLGNEIYDTHKDADEGIKTLTELMELVDMYDPDHNAHPTICSNYMAWENTQKAADIIKLIGYNYTERLYEKHHAEHPDWIIYGSETASCVQSRGVYHFPADRSLLSDADMQCSSLGNSTTSWGARNQDFCIATERDTEYSLGQFLWSGIDYIGEPTPYHTKNSYFGLADTACFPKDAYYLYQAEWTDVRENPMIHILPYWDHNPGQLIDVRVCSNAPEVELFLNGESQGRCVIDHEHGYSFYADYKLIYVPGELKAVAYDGGGYEDADIIAVAVEHSYGDVKALKLNVTDSEGILLADNGMSIVTGTGATDEGHTAVTLSNVKEDDRLFFVTITAQDADGHEVKNANTSVKVTVTGGGRLCGLDNGDATDYESYKGDTKRLFSGRLLAIIRSDGRGEDIRIDASIDESEIRVRKAELVAVSPSITADKAGVKLPVSIDGSRDTSMPVFTPDSDEREFEVRIYPHNALGYELDYEIANINGVKIQNAAVVSADSADCKDNDLYKIRVKAYADGDMKLRVLCRQTSGDAPYLISSLELKAEGFGALNTDPYTFVSASLYTAFGGQIGNGNDNGISSLPQSDSWVAYGNIDFGSGTEEVTIPIFELASAPLNLIFWDGIPHEEGSHIVGTGDYHKKSMWNVYQEQTFKLDRLLKGIGTFAIEIDDHKAHIKGFEFIRVDIAHRLNKATEADEIYGDSFKVREDAVYGIGNNVSLVYKNVDLGREGIGRVSICGHTPMENNSVHIIFAGKDTKERRIVEFAGSDDFVTREFVIEKVSGLVDITFLFLPGCNFDLKSFRFA